MSEESNYRTGTEVNWFILENILHIHMYIVRHYIRTYMTQKLTGTCNLMKE